MKAWMSLVLVAGVVAFVWQGASGWCALGGEEDGVTAVMRGDVEGVERAVGREVARGATAEGACGPLLCLAAWEGQEEVARALLRRGADVNARTSAGWTPLMMAVVGEREEMVRMLLEAGADVGAASDAGATAMSVARGRGYLGIAEMLAEAGAGMDVSLAR